MKSYTKQLVSAVALATLCSSCILVKDTSVNPDKYLKNKHFESAMYSTAPKETLFSPFDMRIETADKIINFDFTGHDKYVFLECQLYNDTIFGKGVVAMLMDQDDKLEMYHTKGLNMRQKHYYFDSNQSSIPTTIFEPQYTFTYENGSIDFSLAFTDSHGSSIVASLNGYYPNYIDFIAPMGLMGSGKPSFAAFPLFYTRKVNFLNSGEGQASITINEAPVKIVKIPGLLNWKRVQLARWSFEPIFILWNWNRKGILPGIPKSDAIKRSSDIKVVNRNGYSEIESIQFTEGNHRSTLNFAPALPELLCLKEGISLKGRFTIDVEEKRGVVGGTYSIVRNGNAIELTIDPIKCWQPIPGASWAKKHYLWISLIVNNDSDVEINSKWRIK